MLTANKITEIEKTAELRGMLPGKSGFKSFVEEMAHNYDITQTEVRKLFTNDLEEWKFIKGYNKRYQISSFGRVKGLKNQIVQTYYNTANSEWFRPYTEDQTRNHISIERAVAETFIKKEARNLSLVNHKNGIRTDNRVENLEWTR